jgi:hypothetical protein
VDKVKKVTIKAKSKFPKAKITITATRIIELNPEYYAEGATFEEMLKAELELADDDTIMYLTTGGVVNWKISGDLTGNDYKTKITRKPSGD